MKKLTNEMKNFLKAVNFEDPVINSNNVVFLFTVKNTDTAKIALLKTGVFDGNEEFIRLRVSSTYGKLDTNQYTVIKRTGNNFSWQSGGGSTTLVSDQTNEMAKLIKDTINQLLNTDFSTMTMDAFIKEFNHL